MTFSRLSVLFTLCLLLLVAWAVWEAWQWPLEARLTAWMIGIPTVLLVAAVLIQELRGRGGSSTQGQEGNPGGQILGVTLMTEARQSLDPGKERRRTTNIIGWIGGFALAILLLGFHVGISLGTLLYLKLAGERWPITLAVSLAVWGSIALFFDCTMHIFFMEGKLFVWLGLKSNQFHSEVCRYLAVLLPK